LHASIRNRPSIIPQKTKRSVGIYFIVVNCSYLKICVGDILFTRSIIYKILWDVYKLAPVDWQGWYQWAEARCYHLVITIYIKYFVLFICRYYYLIILNIEYEVYIPQIDFTKIKLRICYLIQAHISIVLSRNLFQSFSNVSYLVSTPFVTSGLPWRFIVRPLLFSSSLLTMFNMRWASTFHWSIEFPIFIPYILTF